MLYFIGLLFQFFIYGDSIIRVEPCMFCCPLEEQRGVTAAEHDKKVKFALEADDVTSHRLQQRLQLVELLLTHPRLHLDLTDDPLESLQPATGEEVRGQSVWEEERRASGRAGLTASSSGTHSGSPDAGKP